jgi:hypothetical protein
MIFSLPGCQLFRPVVALERALQRLLSPLSRSAGEGPGVRSPALLPVVRVHICYQAAHCLCRAVLVAQKGRLEVA